MHSTIIKEKFQELISKKSKERVAINGKIQCRITINTKSFEGCRRQFQNLSLAELLVLVTVGYVIFFLLHTFVFSSSLIEIQLAHNSPTSTVQINGF